MSKFVSYKNGNYTVMIDTENGTKTRYNDEDFFSPDTVESMDIKICNKCDMNCPMCHENSTPDGAIGDIMSESFIDRLHPYCELALGGGNPLEHPDLIPFLEKCKKLKLIPSMTVNQVHFLKNIELIKSLVDNKLIYGLGVSVTSPDNKFIEEIQKFPNAVIHVINGMIHTCELAKLAHKNLKILILGYKEFRRGETLYNNNMNMIDMLKEQMYNVLPFIIEDNWFKVVSFDNLAIKQLDVKRLMSEDEWNEFYMGDDGEFTMYVDMVKREFAKSSTSAERYPLMDTIEEMFEVVRK